MPNHVHLLVESSLVRAGLRVWEAAHDKSGIGVEASGGLWRVGRRGRAPSGNINLRGIEDTHQTFVQLVNNVPSHSQAGQLAPVPLRIRFAPELAVIGIVFGRVEIGIHAARRAEFEQPHTMRHRPERAEKTLDDAAAAK